VALTTYDELRQAWPRFRDTTVFSLVIPLKEGEVMTTSQTASYRLFVGVDIAKASASVAWMTSDRTLSRVITIDQNPQGFRSLQQRLLATGHAPRTILVVMEATGSYWMNLALSLTQADFQVSVVNPAQAHHFAKALLKRAKTDAIDAQTLAQLAVLLQPAVWNPPPAMFAELYQRLIERESLLGMRQQVRNQLHALTQCPTVIASVRTRMEHLIESLTKQISEVETELDVTLALDPPWTASVARLQTITGIGPLTAAWLVVTTLNFTVCETVEELTAYAGLAPHAYQSGTSVHGRASIGHTGNAALRTAVYLATLSAAQYNPVIKRFYDRLRAVGKPMKVARCAAARKLLHLAWACVKNKEDFDPLYVPKQRKVA
jgi:transposase